MAWDALVIPAKGMLKAIEPGFKRFIEGHGKSFYFFSSSVNL